MDSGVSDRMRAVENDILPAVHIMGRPVSAMTLRERMAHYAVPGVSIAVIYEGEIEWACGFGVAEAGGHTSVTAETRFQAGSISKSIAAMGALHLTETGALDLDEDVNAYLTSWRVPENQHTAEEKVTLRRLLSHSAGLTVHGFPGYRVDAPLPSVPQILDGDPPANTGPVHVDVEPGAEYRYSGGGYTVVQQILEDVTGTPFAELLRAVVLGPLEMADSTYEQPRSPKWADLAASGHQSDGTLVPGRWHIYPEMAAAGLWTTPTDLARFAIEVQRSYAGRSNRVLSQEMTRLMLTEEREGIGLVFYQSGEGDRSIGFSDPRGQGGPLVIGAHRCKAA